MQIVYNGDNLHEMSNPVCLSKIRVKSEKYQSNAEFAQGVAKDNEKKDEQCLFDTKNLSLMSMDTLVKHSVFQKIFLLNYHVPS